MQAYTAAAQAVLEEVPTERKVVRRAAVVRLPYDCFEPCRRAVEQLGAEVTGEEFGAEAVMHLQVEGPLVDELRSRIRDMTSGRVAVEVEEPPPEEG